MAEGETQKPNSQTATPPVAEKSKGQGVGRRQSIRGVTISPDERVSLYRVGRALPKELREKCGLTLPFTTYFQDPFVAQKDPALALNEKVLVAWEPGFADGPTSSRFAVVDYDGDTQELRPPAIWDDKSQKFVGEGGRELRHDAPETLWQFHQVNVWALLQKALAFFEDASALGRPIAWAFEGNRLIVVPHAGYGENAYYDRASKSLQFYYYDTPDGQIDYTCLSSDIVHHELGHAILDGIRPLFHESSHPQTAAFHEFVGDLTAILSTLHNTVLRQHLARKSGGNLGKAKSLSSIAEGFGQAVKGRPYLRTAKNDQTMAKLAGVTSPHRLSEVMTGAMFDVLLGLGESLSQPEGDLESETNGARKSPLEIFWSAADRMQRMAIQPLDLLPPVEATFRDYALAACRAQQLAEPIDPKGHFKLLVEVFRQRGIFSEEEAAELREPHYLFDRLRLSVSPRIDDIARSRASAYRFLDDNREALLIPRHRDFFVADLYDAKKRGHQNLALPRQIILQYAWREEVPLEGQRFGRYAGKRTTLLCGGTLVFNDDGNVLSWMMKPGSEPYGLERKRESEIKRMWAKAVQAGQARRTELLDQIACQIAAGRVGKLLGSPKGLLASLAPPMVAEEGVDGSVRFQFSPHLHLSSTEDLDHEDETTGDRTWQISC